VPIPDPATRGSRRRIILEGEIPNPANPPSGCPFHPRCFRATDICRAEMPRFLPFDGSGTTLACHHPGAPEPADAPLLPERALS